MWDRREILGGALGTIAGTWTATGTATGAVMGSASTGATSMSTPVDEIDLYRKLHLRTDDGVIFWWLQGPKIGQVGATLTPLYTSMIGTLQRIRHLADGEFEVTQLEMILFFDVDGKQPIDEWRNPYTNELIPLKFAPVGPTVTRYRADNTRVLPTEIGGTPLEATAIIHPPIIVGDDVFQRDESVARVFTPGRARPFEVNDIAVYHGSLGNLTDPRVTMGEATVFFAEVTGWQRWMGMGDREGNLTSRLVGRKVRQFEDLPLRWRQRLAELSPEIAANPLAALDRPAGRFDR